MTAEEASKYFDANAAAYQLGRLDFISALLTAIGLALVLGGIFAFINFRSLAKKQAKKEAIRVAEIVAERAANEYIQRELPALLEQYRTHIVGRNVSSQEADAMAKAQEEDHE